VEIFMSRGIWTRKLTVVETSLTYPAPLKIGVLSDTHGLSGRRAEVLEHIRSFLDRAQIDLILHAGDVGDQAILDELARVAPVAAVRGNADPPDLIETLPDQVRIDVGARTVLLLHGHRQKTALTAAKAAASQGVDLIVFGHSHKPWISSEGESILFNPGSPTERRWNPHFGIGLIEVGDTGVEPELILFDDARQLDGLTP
jgi:putative phosphoesterase